MNLQDFFSIVQLGVGIHAGTAILQLSGELGVTPVERRIDDIEVWIRREKERGFELVADTDQLELLRVDLILFRTRYDRLYRRSIHRTFLFGCLITLMLAVMSFFAQCEICVWAGLAIVAFSILPAAIIFARLWRVSSRALEPIKVSLATMESNIKSPDA
jgi:hypothetical protein